MSKKAILAILDGWGIGTDSKVSAIDQANTPFIDSCYKNFPHTTLEASGIAVGLPFGQMGNSEVGHMNLGAGRVVYQNLVKLNIAVENATLGKENVITAAFDYALKLAKENNVKLVVKSKSMASEEMHFNQGFEAAGIHAQETDLGEFINAINM